MTDETRVNRCAMLQGSLGAAPGIAVAGAARISIFYAKTYHHDKYWSATGALRSGVPANIEPT